MTSAFAISGRVDDAEEADWIEQSISVDGDDADEYPYTHHGSRFQDVLSVDSSSR